MSCSSKSSKSCVLGLMLSLLLIPVNSGFAQEHPEHPTTQKPKPKPEVTKGMMSQAIKDFVSRDSKLKGGKFLIFDDKADLALALTLIKVHDDRVSQVGENLYFACSDFLTNKDKVYDLDFFMQGTDSGLQVTEVMIHKEETKPRYTWQEKGGIWKRKEISTKK